MGLTSWWTSQILSRSDLKGLLLSVLCRRQPCSHVHAEAAPEAATAEFEVSDTPDDAMPLIDDILFVPNNRSWSASSKYLPRKGINGERYQ